MSKKGERFTYHADSWDEFVADLKSKPVKPEWGDDLASVDSSEKFTGSKSFEHSMELAEHGCPTTREAIHSASFKVSTDRLPEWDTAPVGVFPCIPAYAAGVPEDMFTPSEWGMETPKPVVRIVVNITVAAMVDKQYIINRGAAIVQLIDRVQLAGQRVELVAVFHANGRNADHPNDKYEYSVTVKRAEEPVDLDRIAYAIAHPSMLRRSMFRIMEQMVPYRVSGYGTATDFRDSVQGRDLYIESMLCSSDGYESRDQSKKTVNDLWDKAAKAA